MLNIVGCASWCPPTNNLDWTGGEIWSINNAHAAWFRREIYYKPDLIIALDDLRRDEIKHPDYVQEIVDAGCPVLNTHNSRKWKNVTAYPLKKVWKMFPSRSFYDNTINYAFMLALYEEYDHIKFHGCDFVPPYDRHLLRKWKANWAKRGYHDLPEWFKYYDEDVIHWRGGTEPGVENFHVLLGYAMAAGVRVDFAKGSTAANRDRDPFFYGYGYGKIGQPKGPWDK